MAFVQNTTPTIIKQPTNVKFQVTSTMVASTNPTAYTAGTNGSKITALQMTGNHSSAIVCSIAISTGGTPNYYLGAFAASTSAGFNSTSVSPVNIMTSMPGLPLDSDGNPYIHLVSGDLLVVIPGSSIASGNVNIYGVAADF